MILLDGKIVSESVRQKLQIRVEKFKNQQGRSPHLVVVLVGEDPASQVYVRNKHQSCLKIGMQSTVIQMAASITEPELRKKIRELNQDNNVDGVLVQLPLPKHLSSEIVAEELSSDKDADGLTYGTMGRFFAGKSLVKSCTPLGVMRMLEHYGIAVSGKKAVVIGRSLIVGKPMFHLLTEAQATVTLCHSKTQNLREYTQAADIVVVAAGQPRFLGRDDFNPNSIVIDVGIHRLEGGKLCGDVRFDELNQWVKALTPVPGGVGPMTITSLLENTMILAESKLAVRN